MFKIQGDAAREKSTPFDAQNQKSAGIRAGFLADLSCMGRSWIKAEIHLLGTKPDTEVGRLLGPPGKAGWAKRQAPGIAAGTNTGHFRRMIL